MDDPREVAISVPASLTQAFDPDWLVAALAPLGLGAATAVEQVELLRTVATKIRFRVRFERSGEDHHFCLKGLLDVDELTARGGPTCVREADFYGSVAPHVAVRVPDCVARIVDRQGQQAVIIMRDLIPEGARFCSALEPFTIDEAARSVEQLAHLHCGRSLLDQLPWITRRIDDLAEARYVPVPQLQDLLDGSRGEGLPPSVRNAENLVAGMRALAKADAERPAFLVHGDSHAGNIYCTADGPGLIDWQLLQRGGWALDLAYHIAAVLPVDVAEASERDVLDHYLTFARALNLPVPDRETAWHEYRQSVIYGYYLWAITRRVEPAIIDLFAGRLGAAVARHDCMRLLGIMG